MVDNCHLFSIGDKIVYGDAALRTKVEEKLRKKLAKISKSKKKSGGRFQLRFQCRSRIFIPFILAGEDSIY